MQRSPALASLSRDHHHALVVAQALRRADEGSTETARATFLRYWDDDGAEHFRREEELLLPAFAGYGDPHHPLVLRALGEHVAIRHRAARLAAERQPPGALRELGELLAAHVRLEERELFPLIEAAMPGEQLAAVAMALEAS
jgi:hemerythrin HHE cation binding domain-containing protein